MEAHNERRHAEAVDDSSSSEDNKHHKKKVIATHIFTKRNIFSIKIKFVFWSFVSSLFCHKRDTEKERKRKDIIKKNQNQWIILIFFEKKRIDLKCFLIIARIFRVPCRVWITRKMTRVMNLRLMNNHLQWILFFQTLNVFFSNFFFFFHFVCSGEKRIWNQKCK